MASAAAAALAAAVVVPWVEARPGVRVDSPSTVVGTRRQGFDVEERPEQEVGSRSQMARDVTSSSHCQCCLHHHLSETLWTVAISTVYYGGMRDCNKEGLKGLYQLYIEE